MENKEKIKIGFLTDYKPNNYEKSIRDLIEKQLFILFYYLSITENDQFKTPIIYLTLQNPKWFNNLIADIAYHLYPSIKIESFRELDKTNELFIKKSDKLFIYSEKMDLMEKAIDLSTVRKGIHKEINFVNIDLIEKEINKNNKIITFLYEKNKECESV